MTETKHRPGWVYILTNTALARGIVKIGQTQVDCEQRMRAVASTHRLPGIWTVEFRRPVRDAVAAERAVHVALEEHRLDWEFFKLPLADAKAAVQRLIKPWACPASEVPEAAPRVGTKFRVTDRAKKAKEAARKAVLRRKRRMAALKAVATRRARAGASFSQGAQTPTPE